MNNPRVLEVHIRVDLDRLADPERAESEVQNAVYKLGQVLFETGGEFNIRADGSRVMTGNGHHDAQEMAAAVWARWAERAR